jgi:LAO/AO transport system kinase
VNKADRAGLEATVRDLQSMLELSGARPWVPPILETVATEDRGVDALLDAVRRHHEHLVGSGELAERRERRIADELRALVLDRLSERADDFCSGPRFATVVRQVAGGTSDPYTAATLLTEGADRGEQ